jgi:hypothetical protein
MPFSLGVVVKTSSELSNEAKRCALLTTKKVLEAINESSTRWSVMEQLIAVELIKKLVGGTPSKLLVPRILHAINGATSIIVQDGEVVKLSWVELDEYVGLRSSQQRLIEKCHAEACEQIKTSVNS